MKIDRRKPNRAVDPEYPFYCRLDEAGEIVYSVPLEAPNDIPEDEGEGAWHPEYSWLPMPGGKKERVYFHETSDREWAFRVRRMLNTAYMRDFRRAKREIPIPEVLGDGMNDGNRRVRRSPDESDEQLDWDAEASLPVCSGPLGYGQPASPDMEKQILDRMEIRAIRERVISLNPRAWEVFCQVRLYGRDVKTVAAETGICPSRVYQLISRVRDIAEQYRRENS